MSQLFDKIGKGAAVLFCVIDQAGVKFFVEGDREFVLHEW